ncbi:MAG: hypothetical protein ABIH86_05410 [Planctomycetota bacterium]
MTPTSPSAPNSERISALSVVVTLSVILIVVLAYFFSDRDGQFQHGDTLPASTSFGSELSNIPKTIDSVTSLRFIKEKEKTKTALQERIGQAIFRAFETPTDDLQACRRLGEQAETFSLSFPVMNVKRALKKGDGHQESGEPDPGIVAPVSYDEALKEINPVAVEPIVLIGFKNLLVARAIIAEKTTLIPTDKIRLRETFLLNERDSARQKASDYFYDGSQSVVVFDKNKMYFGSACVLDAAFERIASGRTLSVTLNARGLSDLRGDIALFFDPSDMAKRYRKAFATSGLSSESKMIASASGGAPVSPLRNYQTTDLFEAFRARVSGANIPELTALFQSIEDGTLEPIQASAAVEKGVMVGRIKASVPEPLYALVSDALPQPSDFSDMLNYIPATADALIAISGQTNKTLKDHINALETRIESMTALKAGAGSSVFERYQTLRGSLGALSNVSLDELDKAFDRRIAISIQYPSTIESAPSGIADSAKGFVAVIGIKEQSMADATITKIINALAERGMISQSQTVVSGPAKYQYVSLPSAPEAGIYWRLTETAAIVSLSMSAMDASIRSGTEPNERLVQTTDVKTLLSSLPQSSVFLFAANQSKAWDILKNNDAIVPGDVRDIIDFSPADGAIWGGLAVTRAGQKIEINDNGLCLSLIAAIAAPALVRSNDLTHIAPGTDNDETFIKTDAGQTDE